MYILFDWGSQQSVQTSLHILDAFYCGISKKKNKSSLVEILSLHLQSRGFYLCIFSCHSKIFSPCMPSIGVECTYNASLTPRQACLFRLCDGQICFCLHACSAGVFWLNQQTLSHDSTACNLNMQRTYGPVIMHSIHLDMLLHTASTCACMRVSIIVCASFRAN